MYLTSRVSLFSIGIFVSFSHQSMLPRSPDTADIEQLAPGSLPGLALELQHLACPTFDLDPEDDQGYDQSLPDTAPTAAPTSSDAPTTTSASDGRPSCSYHGPDPDAFAPEGFCVCASSLTLPLIIPTPSDAPGSSSCEYLTLPPATVTFSRNLPPPQTSNCYVNQQEGANIGSASELPGCQPTGHPQQNITLARQKVSSGDLNGMGFHDQALKLLKPRCPDVGSGGNATCDNTPATIKDVPYVEKEGDEMEEATVSLTIISSTYLGNLYRDMMLEAVARTYNASTSGKNCGMINYNTCNGGASEPENPNDVSPHGKNCGKSILQCNVPELITITVVDGGHTVGVMNVGFSYKINGWSVFDCEFVAGIMDAIFTTLAIVDPASAPEDGSILGETNAVCEDVKNMASGITL